MVAGLGSVMGQSHPAANDKPSAVKVRFPCIEMREWRRSLKLVFWDARECAPGP
jgi:hypothetical protein